MKVIIAKLGCVGLCNVVFLAQQNEVIGAAIS